MIPLDLDHAVFGGAAGAAAPSEFSREGVEFSSRKREPRDGDDRLSAASLDLPTNPDDSIAAFHPRVFRARAPRNGASAGGTNRSAGVDQRVAPAFHRGRGLPPGSSLSCSRPIVAGPVLGLCRCKVDTRRTDGYCSAPWSAAAAFESVSGRGWVPAASCFWV